MVYGVSHCIRTFPHWSDDDATTIQCLKRNEYRKRRNDFSLSHFTFLKWVSHLATPFISISVQLNQCKCYKRNGDGAWKKEFIETIEINGKKRKWKWKWKMENNGNEKEKKYEMKRFGISRRYNVSDTYVQGTLQGRK